MDKNDKYFLVGLISLAITLFLLPFACYLLPSVLFGWTYHIPDFVFAWTDTLQDMFSLNSQQASWAVWGIFFVSAAFFAVIAYVTSTKIKDEKPKISVRLSTDADEVMPVKKDTRENLFLAIKIIAIIVLMFLLAQGLQWVMSSS